MTKSSPKKEAAQDTSAKFEIFDELNFDELWQKTKKFADHIENNFEKIADILLEYESFEVVKDETERTLDILRNLNVNKDYFRLRIGGTTSFLPRNQPLYALTCFVVVPSLMATESQFRIPHSMRSFFPKLLQILDINSFFPNVLVSKKERIDFLEERSSLMVDAKNGESRPVSEAVIFTGTPVHAEKLRIVFDQRTLFITNGSGHNPVVVSDDADLEKAVHACLDLQLYNQGQDCAAPNTFLVHEKIFDQFLVSLRTELKKVKVGHYKDRSCRVGPISDPDDLVRIQNLLVENAQWLDESTKGIIRTAETIVEPTIICKPLDQGGNFSEVFSPLIFIQKYEKDSKLSQYFEDRRYARNAMYITLFGSSKYIQKFINKKENGKILHDETTLLINKHLHMRGVERGVKPYGGYGYGASNFCIHGKVISKPTLPQRDIYEQLVLPILEFSQKEINLKKDNYLKMNKVLIRDVRKLFSLKPASTLENSDNRKHAKSYFDSLDIIASDSQRYIEFLPEKTFNLLAQPNVEFISIMEPKRIHQIRSLVKFLKDENINSDKLNQFIFDLPKEADFSPKENKSEQFEFFRNIYQLLMGTDYGPRLAYFLLDADKKQIFNLLNV